MNVSLIWYFELIWTSEAPGGVDMNWPNQGDLRQTRKTEGSGALSTLGSPLSTTPRKDPFMVRGSWRKVLVSATLENRKENAYNTSLSLSFSRNLHLSSLTPQVPLGEGIGRSQGGRKKEIGVLAVRGSRERLCLEAVGRRVVVGPALASTPITATPLLSAGQPGEGGMHGPFPSCPALQCGPSCLSDGSQGELGPTMRKESKGWNLWGLGV